MSITSEKNRMAELTTDGVETEFDFDLLIHADSELEVYYKTTVGDYAQLVLNTDYTVGFGIAGGTVTTIGGSSPRAAGSILIIRHLPITQQTNWLYNDNHTEQTHQDDFDRTVMRDLQIQEQLDRCPSFLTTSSTTGITFPEPLADAHIGWNSDGDDLENKVIIVGITIPALTPGSVLFADAAGGINQDNDNLFYDETKKRLGIKNKIPTSEVDVSGTVTMTRLLAGGVTE